jgi:hypothetical protein
MPKEIQRARWPKAYRVLAGGLLVAVSGCGLPENRELSASQVPVCDGTSDESWNRIAREFLEVAATTPDFLELGVGKGERGGGWSPHADVWFPVDGFKAAICGPLQGHAWQTGDDFDWNLDVGIDPQGSQQERIDQFRHRFHSTEFGSGRFPRIHVETAPEQSFPDRAGFWAAQLGVMDEGKLGAFGPWVGDLNPSHDEAAIPEIHPAELFWWRQTVGADDAVFWLLVMQDSVNQYNRRETYYSDGDFRNRFRDRDYFDFDGRPEPPGWRPWAKGPIHAQYRIAFEVLADEPPARFWIVPQAKLAVLKTPAPDMDDGHDHRLTVDGREVLRATEVADHTDTAVGVADLCRTERGGVRGFLEVSTWAGVDAPDAKGGYHFLAAIRNGGTPLLLRKPVARPDLAIAARAVAESNPVRKEGAPAMHVWLDARPTTRAQGAAGLWPEVDAELGAPGRGHPPAEVLHAVVQWDVDVSIDFGPLKGDRVHLEDASTAAVMLTRQAMASARIEWRVEASEGGNGAPIPVIWGSAGGEDAIGAEAVFTGAPQGRLRIRLPRSRAAHLLRARVTAIVKDGRGNETKASTDLWNCALTASNRGALESATSSWLDIPDETKATRRGGLLQAAMRDRTADNLLTIEELRSLGSIARAAAAEGQPKGNSR